MISLMRRIAQARVNILIRFFLVWAFDPTSRLEVKLKDDDWISDWPSDDLHTL